MLILYAPIIFVYWKITFAAFPCVFVCVCNSKLVKSHSLHEHFHIHFHAYFHTHTQVSNPLQFHKQKIEKDLRQWFTWTTRQRQQKQQRARGREREGGGREKTLLLLNFSYQISMRIGWSCFSSLLFPKIPMTAADRETTILLLLPKVCFSGCFSLPNLQFAVFHC